jgi:hypothetical protein
VPIPAPLRELLLPHLLRTGRRGDDLVFGSTATEPFEAKRLRDRADAAWTEAKLRRITLHECRHTFASYMIAAGVNVKALSTFMGTPGSRSRSTATATCSRAPRARRAGCWTPTSTRPGGTVHRRLARTSGPHRGRFRFAKGESANGTACTTSDHGTALLGPMGQRRIRMSANVWSSIAPPTIAR